MHKLVNNSINDVDQLNYLRDRLTVKNKPQPLMATLLKFIMDKCIELYLGSKPDQEDFNEDKKLNQSSYSDLTSL